LLGYRHDEDNASIALVRLAEQWSEVLAELPRGWRSASLTLSLDDPADAARAAVLLGPAAPGRSDSSFRVDVVREARPVGTSAELFRRVLQRLDREGIEGRLAVAAAAEPDGAEAAERPAPSALAGQWEALLGALPVDWSHLLAELELDSSDYLDRGALLLAPVNPTLVGSPATFRFRAARAVGYGASTGMVRRCLERLDRERITGRTSIVHVVSDAQPVATQGPVWRMGGRVV
jgi:hypothetical protein